MKVNAQKVLMGRREAVKLLGKLSRR